MSIKKITLILLIVSLVGLGVGYVLTNSVQFGFCSQDKYSCRELLNNIGDPLFYGMSALAFIFLVLLFHPETFSAWKKFAKWFIPLATLLFIFYPNPGSGDYFSPYPEQVFQWVSILYVVVSVFIITLSGKKQSTLV